MLFSRVFYFLLTTVFGIIFGLVIESILFFIAFFAIRSSAGGIHAKKEYVCMICTSILLLFSIAAIKIFIVFSFITLPSILLGAGSIIISVLSPLDSEGKKLSSYEKKRYRIKSIIIVIILDFFAAISHISGYGHILYVCSVSLALESGLLLFSVFQRPSLNKRDDTA